MLEYMTYSSLEVRCTKQDCGLNMLVMPNMLQFQPVINLNAWDSRIDLGNQLLHLSNCPLPSARLVITSPCVQLNVFCVGSV